MQKRILIIRNAAKKDFGGGERAPVFIAREIEETSDYKVVILSGSKKLRDFADSNNIENHFSPWLPYQNWSGWRVFLTPFYIIWQLLMYLYYIVIFLRYRPSIVHPQSRDDFISATFAARILDIPVVWSDYADLKHNLKNILIWYKNPVGKLVYLAAKFSKRIIVVSKEDKRLILSEVDNSRWLDKHMTVIYNGAFNIAVESKKSDNFTFVCSSRLVIDKGIGDLLVAFAKFQKKHNSVQLNLLGDGPDRRLFEDQSKEIPNVFFLGHKNNPLSHVKSADVYVIPTHHEGFSLSLVEACMLGMPIIATDVGGNPEIIINMKTGLLVPIMDPLSLFDAMEDLYNNPKLRKELAKNARKSYEDSFEFQKIIRNDFLPLYDQLIHSKKSTSGVL